MSTITSEQQEAQARVNVQVIASIDKQIEELQRLRGKIVEAGDALEGLSVNDPALNMGLFQLHADEGANVRAAARSLSWQAWRRRPDGTWRSNMPGETYAVIIHNAEPKREPADDIVEL